MKKTAFPIFATLLVIAAVVTMIALGIWQIQRAQWKSDLLAEYQQASDKPAIEFPFAMMRSADDAATEKLPYFRQSALFCHHVKSWRAVSARNEAGLNGWGHIAYCEAGKSLAPVEMDVSADKVTVPVMLGWSNKPEQPKWSGGAVRGLIAPDSRDKMRLIAQPAVAGLANVAPPSADDIPNNHIAYAVQWFFFALIALVIYILALRKKRG